MVFGMRENGGFCIYTCTIDKLLERIFLDRLPHPTFQPLFMVSLLFICDI
jgi:hypothetical protein